MRFRARIHFYDLTDNRREYLPGDEYPRKGLKPSEDRIAFLLSSDNKTGKPAIEAVEEEKPKRRKKADAD